MKFGTPSDDPKRAQPESPANAIELATIGLSIPSQCTASVC